MRVGLDAIPLATPRTGVGHYTSELAHHLAIIAPADEFELVTPFINTADGDTPDIFPPNLTLVNAKVNMIRRRWFAIGLPLYVRQARFDIFHGTNYEVPLLGKCPSVLTVHDLSLFLHPNTHEERLVQRGRLRLPMMVRSASRIITPSESVRRELCQQLHVEPRKVIAIPEAPRSNFRRMPVEQTFETRKRLKVEDEFILVVGTIEPRKNLRTLLRAFEEILSSTAHRPQLVIAGKTGWLTDELFRDIEKSSVKDRLLFTGYVSDEDLCALYSSCRVFVYPSQYEGFGLPPLEAMACGAPVVTTRIPSILETVGVESARIASPADAQDLAANIIALLDDEAERGRLSSLGQERAAQFTWEQTARATMEVYREVAGHHALESTN